MANNWKYSTLNDRERMNLIGKGNTDVYQAEKSNTASLINQYKSQGLDTSKLEAWDTAIDSRYSKALSEKANQNKIHFSNVPESVTNLIDMLTSQYVNDKNQAIKNAQNARKSLDEWLANNGLSANTQPVKNKIKEIESDLEATLKKLKNNYSSSVSKISY